MPYIFSVDKTNFSKCVGSRLFGVPNSARALSQILPVKEGEKLFLYVYGPRKVYGIYRARSKPFREEDPRRGPWTGRKRDERYDFYPYRIEIEIVGYYENGIDITKVEGIPEIGIDRHSFNGKSVMYIDEFQANWLEKLLKEVNPQGPSNLPQLCQFPSKKGDIDITNLPGTKEEKLQVLAQENVQHLNFEVIDAYYNITECLSCRLTNSLDYAGQIDLLARNKEQDFVILELKAGRAQPLTLDQLRRYSLIVEKSLAKRAQANVLPIIICGRISSKQLSAAKSHDIDVFVFRSDFRSYIELTEKS